MWLRQHHLLQLSVAQREPRLQQRRERRRDVRLEAEAEHLRPRRHHLLQLRVAQRKPLSHGRFAESRPR